MSTSIPNHPEVVVPEKVLHWIGGEAVPSESGEAFENRAPAHDQTIAMVALGGDSDINRAVAAAKQSLETSGFAKWPKTRRSQMLHKIADALEKHSTELAVLESFDTGKPLSETSTGDIPRAIANFRFFAELLVHDSAATYCDDPAVVHTSLRQGIGIVGLITPWNLPLYLTTWKLAPALAAGNAVIIKPAELTPMTAYRLGEICLEAGVPPGLVNVIQGYGPSSAGEALVKHPEVKAISFTGETTTGQAIMAAAAPGLKKLSFELGGKGASVVCADADLDAAAPVVARAAFRNQGQICLAGSRLLVAEAVAAPFLEKVLASVRQIRLGDPLDPQTTMGSLICNSHRDKVAAAVHASRDRQVGEILVGGSIPDLGKSGAYYQPTIIQNVPQADALIQQEIFGPVLTVQTFKQPEDAITMVNGTSYGLSCSIWTQNSSLAHSMASQVDMGLVWINSWFLRDLHTAFGGFKQSGVGREGGRYSLDFFSEQKTITWNY